MFLELILGDAERGGALLADRPLPDFGAAEDRIGIDDVDADADGAPSRAMQRARWSSAALTAQ